MENERKSIDTEDGIQRLATPDGDDGPTASNAMPRLTRSVVLIGLMGAGKSCVGRRLAARLELSFADSDAEIEMAAGYSVAEIFTRFGEQAFREGERRVMARLLAAPTSIIATGGGAFMNSETRRLIAEQGLSIWLRADLELLLKRTCGRDHRPLLKTGDPREILAKLIDQRYPIYAQADITVESRDQPAEATVDAVLAALRAHLSAPQSY
jgi:shikimate kinase